jgi:hypothetical protein
VIAVCPTDPTHRRFLTVAHVMEEWEVDEKGNFIQTTQSLQTDHGPDPDNIWGCVTCGAEAKVTRG